MPPPIGPSNSSSLPAVAPGFTQDPVKNEVASSTSSTGSTGKAQPNWGVIADRFFSHTAALTVAHTSTLGQARKAGADVADAVMRCIGTYDKHYLLNTDGLREHIAEVSAHVVQAASQVDKPGSAATRLKAQYPGAHISVVGTSSTGSLDQWYFVVQQKDGTTKKIAEEKNGSLVEVPNASGLVFVKTDLTQQANLKVRVPEVRFLIDPLSPPAYGVGRTVAVVMDEDTDKQKRNPGDSVSAESWGLERERLPGNTKGEDGQALSQMLYGRREEKGVILKYDGGGKYDVQVTHPDGTQEVKTLDERTLRNENDPEVFSLNGSRYDDVSVNVNKDASLAAFVQKAKAIGDADIPTSGTPEEITAGQKKALVDLTTLCNQVLSYPEEDAANMGPADKKYDELANSHSNWNPMKLGDLIDCGRGVCRHQAILMQVACQTVGIPSRMLSATANTGTNEFRGYHAFLETELDDGNNYLTDPTWFDAGPSNVQGRTQYGPQYPDGHAAQGTPYFDTLYFNARRQVIPDWNENDKEVNDVVSFQENNDPVIDSNGKVVVGGTGPVGPVNPGGPVDVPTLMSSVRTTLFTTDWQQWGWGANFDPSQVPAQAWQDRANDAVQKGDEKTAAVYASLGIEYGSGATPALNKSLWKTLNDACQSVSSLTGMADVSKQVQDAFNALP